MKITVNGNSFYAKECNEFEAGIMFGIFYEHANGGGFGLDNVSGSENDRRVWEKHTDGKAGLAKALCKLIHVREGGIVNIEFDDAAKAEIDRRLRKDYCGY
jgi:hypothetical protein